jgi:hypothetical protein
MSSREKLEEARDILMERYRASVREIILENDRPVLKVKLNSEISRFIRYNDYSEYTYLAIFSPEPDDLLRFDNYDNQWDVDTRPHHFHPRGSDTVLASPMQGIPESDIPLFFNAIADALQED